MRGSKRNRPQKFGGMSPIAVQRPYHRDPRVHQEVTAFGGIGQYGSSYHDSRMTMFPFRDGLPEVLDSIAQGYEPLAVGQDDRSIERRVTASSSPPCIRLGWHALEASRLQINGMPAYGLGKVGARAAVTDANDSSRQWLGA